MAAPETSPQVAPPTVRRLTRPRDDRMVAGVASGLARYLGIDPVIVRLVVVILAVAGGGGVLAYLVGWIIIPSEPEGAVGAPAATGGAGGSAVAGMLLIALGGLLLVERVIPAFSWRYVGPALLIALGVLLLARRGHPS